MAGFEAGKEGIWLRAVLKGINFQQPNPTVISCDNISAIILSEDPSLHYRVKHVDTNYHFLHERVQSNELTMKYIPSSDNIADIFTKSTHLQAEFIRLHELLGLR
jgi:hypothetical protein